MDREQQADWCLFSTIIDRLSEPKIHYVDAGSTASRHLSPGKCHANAAFCDFQNLFSIRVVNNRFADAWRTAG